MLLYRTEIPYSLKPNIYKIDVPSPSTYMYVKIYLLIKMGYWRISLYKNKSTESPRTTDDFTWLLI